MSEIIGTGTRVKTPVGDDGLSRMAEGSADIIPPLPEAALSADNGLDSHLDLPRSSSARVGPISQMWTWIKVD